MKLRVFERDFKPQISRVDTRLGFGLSLMVLADLHFHYWGKREEALIKSISKFSDEVDAVFVLGDSYDERTESLDPLVSLLKSLNKPKFGVLGNHEHWANTKIPLEEGIGALREAGVRVLINESVEELGIRIGGIDWFEEEDQAARYLDEVGEVDILLSHTPDVIELDPRSSLVLAGHTHGGQVCFPIIGPIWTPSKYGTKYASGLFRVRGRLLYVSRGLGEMNPVRLNCPRELALLRI